MEPTIVHVARHGQVHNPEHVLYGRSPGFVLSGLGERMAERLAEFFADVPLNLLLVSPLERARQTMAPVAARHPHLEVGVDPRLIEAANALEGRSFGRFNERLLLPTNLVHLRNPLRPSWGEPFVALAVRMRAAIADAAASVPSGGQALLVSHQLPIWVARRDAEGRRLATLPVNRECTLASVTSFHVVGGRVTRVTYAEPAADLLPPRRRGFRPGA